MGARICFAVVLITGLAACTHLGDAHRVAQAPASSLPPASAPAPLAPAAAAAPPATEPSAVAQPVIPDTTKTAVAGKLAPPTRAAKPAMLKPAKGKTPTASVPVAPAPLATGAPLSAAMPSTPKPQLDFKAMEQRLRDTSAIGVFTKLSIKNQVDDLLKAFGQYHAGRTPPSLDDLHARYDGLLMKVVSLLQNDDATLASSISASRNAIWERLSNAQSFQAI